MEPGGSGRRLPSASGDGSAHDWDWQSERARPLRETLTELYSHLIAPIQEDLARAEARLAAEPW